MARHGIILALVKAFLQTRRLFVAIFVIGLFIMAARPVTDPDVWWHLRTGQLMLQTHRIFHTDPYSFTRMGQPWIDHEWLSQILIFGLYRAAAWSGLIGGFAVIIAGAFFLMFLRCPGRPYVAGVVTLWGAIASIPIWGVRPQMITLLLASILLLMLERSYQRPRLLWWTPPLLLLWANLHAGYALGIVLLVLFFAGDLLDATFGFQDNTRSGARFPKAHFGRLALVTLACLAVVPLNPNGFRMYAYPLETLRSRAMLSYISEWASPDFHQHMYLPALMMMLATIILPMLSPRKLRPRELLLLSATMYAALRSARHIPIFVLVAVPLLSAMAQELLEKLGATRRLDAPPKPLNRSIALLNAALLATVVILAGARFRYVVRGQPAIEALDFPSAVVAFLTEQKPAGPILNHYNWGGYFIWKLYPDYRVFVDGRADLYGDEFLDEQAGTYFLRGKMWPDLLQKWSIRTVILPPDAPLITALRATPEWKPIYSDKQAVVLSRIR